MKNMFRLAAMLLALTLIATILCSIPAFGAAERATTDIPGVEEDDSDVDVPFDQERKVRSISIHTKPNKLVYLQGEKLDLTGLVVKAVYTDNTNTILTNCPASGYDPNQVGKQTITVSFNDKTASFTVTVYAIGDVNGDFAVNDQDAELLLQYAAAWDVKIQEFTSDVNGDGVIDGNDATLLLQYVAGWPVVLG